MRMARAEQFLQVRKQSSEQARRFLQPPQRVAGQPRRFQGGRPDGGVLGFQQRRQQLQGLGRTAPLQAIPRPVQRFRHGDLPGYRKKNGNGTAANAAGPPVRRKAGRARSIASAPPALEEKARFIRPPRPGAAPSRRRQRTNKRHNAVCRAPWPGTGRCPRGP